MFRLTLGPEVYDRRRTRAYTDATYMAVEANPTAANVLRALEQYAIMNRDSEKTQSYALPQVVSVALAGYDVVFDGGTYNRPGALDSAIPSLDGEPRGVRTFEHLFGYIVPRSETPGVITDRSALYVHGYHAVMAGIEHEDRIRDPRLQVGGVIPLVEALQNLALTDEGENHRGERYAIGSTGSRNISLRQAAAILVAAQAQR